MKFRTAVIAAFIGCFVAMGGVLYLAKPSNAALKAIATQALSPSTIATANGGEDTVTAFATGGQASATALSSTVTNHRVTVVATAADSVKLPAATVGQSHYVRNDGANAMQVFGQATETINGVASATGISQAPGMGVWYICTTAGAWTTTPVSTITATTGFLAPSGAGGTPSFAFSGATSGGIYNEGSGFTGVVGSNGVDLGSGTTNRLRANTTGAQLRSDGALGWSSAAVDGTASDAVIARAGTNSIQFGQTTATTAARTELNKSVTGIADAAATAVLTITVPNAAHSASVQVRLTCSLGGGGAIGANEATASNTYVISLTRTAGVNATAAISTAFGGAATAVAGAATVTATAAMSAVSGAVGATNTFTVNATVTRSGGSSTNHTCLVYAQLMNANATGITIS